MMDSTPDRSRVRLLVALIAAGVLASLIGAVLRQSVHRKRIVDRARAAGLILQFENARFGLRTARLRGVRFALDGFEGLSGVASEVEVDLSRGEPASVAAHGVEIAIARPPLDGIVGFAKWFDSHPATFALPMTAEDIRVTWTMLSTNQRSDGRASSLAPRCGLLTGGRLKSTAQGGSVSARGPGNEENIAVSWFSAPTLTTFDVARDGSPPDVVFELLRTSKPAILRIRIASEWDRTGWLLGVVSKSTASVQATAELSLEPLARGTVEGQVQHWKVGGDADILNRSLPDAFTFRASIEQSDTDREVSLMHGRARAGRAWFHWRGALHPDGEVPAIEAQIPCETLARDSNSTPALQRWVSASTSAFSAEEIESRVNWPSWRPLSSCGMSEPPLRLASEIEFVPKKIAANVGDVVALTAEIRAAGRVNCQGPIRVLESRDKKLVPTPAVRHVGVEAVVAPWEFGVPTGESGTIGRSDPYLNASVAVRASRYDEVAPVWVDDVPSAALPALTYTRGDDDVTVHYSRGHRAAARMRAMLVEGSMGKVLYAEERLSRTADVRWTGVQTDLSYPNWISTPVRVVVARYGEDACDFEVHRMTIEN